MKDWVMEPCPEIEDWQAELIAEQAQVKDQYAHEQVMSRPEHFVNQTAAALRERQGIK